MAICYSGRKGGRRLYSEHDEPAVIRNTIASVENLIAFVKSTGKGYYSKEDG